MSGGKEGVHLDGSMGVGVSCLEVIEGASGQRLRTRAERSRIPAQFRVLVARRPKCACSHCSQAVARAHAPEHVIPGGLPTESFIA